MSTHAHTPPHAGVLPTPDALRHPVQQSFLLLRIAFTVAPILFGIDGFAEVMTHWTKYLASEYNDIIPGTASQAMHAVGVVEIAAGLLVAVRPRIGAYVVAAGWRGSSSTSCSSAATATSRYATSASCSAPSP